MQYICVTSIASILYEYTSNQALIWSQSRVFMSVQIRVQGYQFEFKQKASNMDLSWVQVQTWITSTNLGSPKSKLFHPFLGSSTSQLLAVQIVKFIVEEHPNWGNCTFFTRKSLVEYGNDDDDECNLKKKKWKKKKNHSAACMNV